MLRSEVDHAGQAGSPRNVYYSALFCANGRGVRLNCPGSAAKKEKKEKTLGFLLIKIRK